MDFRSDPFEAAIRMGDGHWPDTVSRRLFGRRIVAVCHPDLIARNGAPFAIQQLPAQALIHNASMSGLWQERLGSAGVVASAAMSGIEVQGSAQVLEAIHAEEAIGLVDLGFIRDDLEDGRLALACGHVLTGVDGYFLTYPEKMHDRTSLQIFEQWIFAHVDAD